MCIWSRCRFWKRCRRSRFRDSQPVLSPSPRTLTHPPHIHLLKISRTFVCLLHPKGLFFHLVESHVLEILHISSYRSIHLLLSQCHFSTVSTHTDSLNIPASRRGIFLGSVEHISSLLPSELKHSTESIPIPFLRLTVPINFPYSTT